MLKAGREAAARRAGGGPEPKRPVDVAPGAVSPAELQNRIDRVEGAGVDLAGLDTDDRRAVVLSERRLELRGQHAALVVGRHTPNALGTETEHATRDSDRHMGLFTCDHAQGRSALQAVGLHIPPRLAQDGESRRREAGEVGHLATRDETHAAAGRETQHVANPGSGHFLGDGKCR